MSDVKGRAKEAADDLTGDKDLKREGKTEQAADKLKDGVDKVAHTVKKVPKKDKS